MDAADGYQLLRAAAEEVAADLGGHHFMHGLVARQASDELRRAFRDTDDSRDVLASHLANAFWLLASEGCFHSACRRLREAFRLDDAIPVTHRSAEHLGGHLVLRGESLWFETTKARFILVHSRVDSGSSRMAVWVTSEGELFAEAFGVKPAAARVHTKAGEGAIKAIQRFAADAFKLPVTPAEATATGA